MPVAALYDIHSNLPALEAVLEEVRREHVDRVVIGGDVLLGPMPRETLACLASLDIPADYIRGNCEREVLQAKAGTGTSKVPEEYREALRWVGNQLDSDQEQLVASWPLTLRMAIPGLGDVLFCHATPRDDNEIFTRLTPEGVLAPIFDGASAGLVVCGHTHMQFDRMIGRTRVVNAGSVGMPFGETGAYWLLLGPDVRFRRTDYDLEAAAGRIRRTRYPKAADFAANEVLAPRPEHEILALFGKAELK